MLVEYPGSPVPPPAFSLPEFTKACFTRSVRILVVAGLALGGADFGLHIIGFPAMSTQPPLYPLVFILLLIFTVLVGALCEALERLHQRSGVKTPLTIPIGTARPRLKVVAVYSVFTAGAFLIYFGPSVFSSAQSKAAFLIDPLFRTSIEAYSDSLGSPAAEIGAPNIDEYFQEQGVAIYFDKTPPDWAIFYGTDRWEPLSDFPRDPRDNSTKHIRDRFKDDGMTPSPGLDVPLSGLATIYFRNQRLNQSLGWSKGYCIYRGQARIQRFEHGWVAGPFKKSLGPDVFTGFILYDDKSLKAISPEPMPTWAPECVKAPFK
jgi:hypothetical protein